MSEQEYVPCGRVISAGKRLQSKCGIDGFTCRHCKRIAELERRNREADARVVAKDVVNKALIDELKAQCDIVEDRAAEIERLRAECKSHLRMISEFQADVINARHFLGVAMKHLGEPTDD